MAAPRTTRGAGAWGLVVLVSLAAHAQQTRVVVPAQPPPADAATGTAAITGAVFDAASDRPVGGAIVTLEERRLGARRRSYVQIAAPSGRFAFVDLPAAATYILSAAKAGYLAGGYGRSDPRGPSAPIALSDGQWVRDVRVALARPGSISGMVVDERGEAIVGAYVRVLPQVMVAGRTQWLAGAVATTDDRGVYRVPGLGPGKYVVSLPSVQATLPASATIEPPGAWAGTSRADLRAASDHARAEKRLVDMGGGQQMVVGRHAVPPPPTPDGERTAYPIAFYPNVTTPADATPVELEVSEDRSNIDFQLRPHRTARLSGVVQGPPDAVGNLHLRLIPAGLEEFGQGSEAATTVTLADGRFTFFDVPIGSYVLDASHTLLELTYTSMDGMPTALPAPVPFAASSATSMGVSAAPPGVQLSSLQDRADVSYWVRLPVTVGAADVDDLVVPLRPPVRLAGRFVWAPGATPSRRSLVPVLEPADGRRSLGLLTPRRDFPAADPASFTFDGLMAGDYLLRVGIGSDVSVESITWDGQDYTDRPFDASAGDDITGVVMTLTNAMSSIGGTVRDGNSPLSSGAAVMAFPVERERWSHYGFNPTRLRSVLTTGDGRYLLTGLPVGEYFLLAVPPAQERAWIDPAFLATHAARATRVRVDRSDAAIHDVALTLVK
jgi:hypothetical protein